MRSARSDVRRIAFVALACFLIAAAAVTALHLLRPDLDPCFRHLSEYAVGEWGGLMTTAFIEAAVGAWALALLLLRCVERSRPLRIAVAAIAAAASCEALMAVFGTDLTVPLPGMPWERTTHGRIHDFLALAHGIAWTVAVVALPIALHRDRRWKELARLSWVSTLVVVATVASRALSPPGTMGLTQRLWIASILVWGVFHAVAAWRRSAVPDGVPAD